MGREIKRVPMDYVYKEGEHEAPSGDGYQIWENVSEGSPVSKVFATEDDIIEHLHKEGATGTFAPCTRAAARKFVGNKSAPTGMICRGYAVDGINAYSLVMPAFLNGFDFLSDEIIDLLKKKECEGSCENTINELLLKFRDRTDKFTQVFEAAGKVYNVSKKFQGELPKEIKEAVEDYDALVKKIYEEE